MNYMRFSAILLIFGVASVFGYSQEKIDPVRDIKKDGDATHYLDGTGHFTTPAGGGSSASNGVVDTTGGTYNTACGIVLDERATGTTTVNLPAVATGCSGVIGRGPSAGVITIAPPSGVSYDGTTTQLPQGQSIGWWYDGTSYHSTRPLIPGSNATYTPSLTGNTLDFAPTGGSSGSLVLLESHTASNSTQLDFTSWYSSTYDDYIIKFVNVIPVTNNVDLGLRFSSNGGTSYDTTSSYKYYLSYVTCCTSNGAFGSSSGTYMRAAGSIGNLSGYSVIGQLEIFNPALTTPVKLMQGQVSDYDANNSALLSQTIIGGYFGTSGINAIRVYFTSGNISSGTVRIYGVAH